jgi:hypothetical protein
LVDQMLRIGTSAHDDWADAGSDVFHPEIYTPTRRQGVLDAQPNIARPWDRELQDQDAWRRQAYDDYVASRDQY